MHPVIAALHLRWQRLFDTPVADFSKLPKVGGMGTMPSRAAGLPAALAEILPQVDRLHLFLHGYDTVPDIARHPKILPYLAPREHPFRAAGKYYGLQFEQQQSCVYLGFDDDILYRAGHVARLIRALKRYRGRVVVGIHGARYLSPEATFRTHRRSYHFERFLPLDYVVDMVGTGTLAFISSELPMFPPDWRWGDMLDLMTATEAEQRNMPRVVVARPARSIVAIATNQDDSIWRAATRDDTRQTEQLRALLELMGKRPKS